MENGVLSLSEKKTCIFCRQMLEEDSHGNRKAHKSCAYRNKKLRQKEKYQVGNSAKLLIQKNEEVAAYLYKLDKERRGIHHLTAMELGFKFECPSIKSKYMDTVIYMFDKYGYSFETIDGEILIFLYHESDLK